MDTIGYLDAIKAARSLPSDYATARELQVTPQQVSKWRRGIDTPAPLIAYRIADILRMDPARVVADLERERAAKSGKVEQADAWEKWAERLTGTAAAVVVGAAMIGPGPADARGMAPQVQGGGLYIMSTRRAGSAAARRALGRVLAGLCRPCAPLHLAAA